MRCRRGRCLVVAICATAGLVSVAVPAPALSEPALSVRAAALIDARTGQPLYTYAAHKELAIASTTKLMTALLTLEHVHRLSTVSAPE